MLGLEFFKMNFFRFSTIPVVILTLVPAFYDQTNFKRKKWFANGAKKTLRKNLKISKIPPTIPK